MVDGTSFTLLASDSHSTTLMLLFHFTQVQALRTSGISVFYGADHDTNKGTKNIKFFCVTESRHALNTQLSQIKTMLLWLAAMIVIGAAYLVIRLERWQYLRYIDNREGEEEE